MQGSPIHQGKDLNCDLRCWYVISGDTNCFARLGLSIKFDRHRLLGLQPLQLGQLPFRLSAPIDWDRLAGLKRPSLPLLSQNCKQLNKNASQQHVHVSSSIVILCSVILATKAQCVGTFFCSIYQKFPWKELGCEWTGDFLWGSCSCGPDTLLFAGFSNEPEPCQLTHGCTYMTRCLAEQSGELLLSCYGTRPATCSDHKPSPTAKGWMGVYGLATGFGDTAKAPPPLVRTTLIIQKLVTGSKDVISPMIHLTRVRHSVKQCCP